MSGAEVILYQTADGRARVECRFEDGRVWLTQAQLATLYQTTPQNITQHLRAIYAEAELTPEATCKEYLQVRTEGRRAVSRAVLHYDLSAIVAVGFRVRSPRGTQFRQWAIDRLGEYLLKGFTMDDERLKNPPGPGVPDYFDEQLARIRDIRASERRVYLRLRDIFALAADYVPSDAQTQTIFQTVQNKMLFVATGKTAPELIVSRADAAEANMGLTGWSRDVVRKSDVFVAKNYLNEAEIDELNRIVVMFLDFAEDQAKRRKQVFLGEWPVKLDDFLRFNDRPVLATAGTVSRQAADRHAAAQYEAFDDRRRLAREQEGEAELVERIEAANRTRPGRKS
jgi:hypothetical protein